MHSLCKAIWNLTIVENCVLQGDTIGSILASVQEDSIGKECATSDNGYKYQNILPIGMLGLVDDTICISVAGYKAKMMNAFFDIKTAEKALQLGAKKCKTMLVGLKTLKKSIVTNFLWIIGK